MKISLLIMNAYGMGGTVRATFTLADELAERHDVEIISVFRHRERPFLPLSARVALRSLVDTRAATYRWWQRKARDRLDEPSSVVHPEERAYGIFNAQSDVALQRELARLHTDVLIPTRPALNLAAARFTRRGVLRVGQEHLHLGAHRPGLLAEISANYPDLDAVVTLTEADRDAYAAMFPDLRVHAIGNGLPDRPWPRSRQDNRIIVAAGRMVHVKGYDRLLDAFAQVVAKRPDWRLRLYGDGSQERKLRRRTIRLGLHNHVMFMGRTSDLDGELAKASLHAVTSRFEGFGMTILEAYACGVPVVSFDCPQGPREIITSGHDGTLVPDGDIDGFADALVTLIDDRDRRHRMAANALATAERYRIGAIADRWDEVFAELRRNPGR